MKVVSAGTMQKAERLAMDNYRIPGQVLMETAGRVCADIVDDQYGPGRGKSAVIVAGKGNNGGDGYVIARCLLQKGWTVTVFVLAGKESIVGDAEKNLSLLEPSIVHFCPEADGLIAFSSVFSDASVIVDALFGIGLSKNISGIHAEAVHMINSAGRPVVAVDIPSGIDASSGRILGVAVKADVTITFAFAKLGHVVYPGRAYTGMLETVDIGLPLKVAESVEYFEYLDGGCIRPLLKSRGRCGHKGRYGHCLIIAGSTGKTGAASLSANTAVRAGSGLVTLAVPSSLNAILEVKTTESMTLPLPDGGKGHLGEENVMALLRATTGKDAVALGPGISTSADTVAFVQKFVRDCPVPLVLDADGLNAVATDVAVLLEKKSPTVILTPHPGEMSRLTGVSIDHIENNRIAVARDFAMRYAVYLVLKGAGTLVAAPDGTVAINSSGNPGMASGGMGDVLTGIIVSLIGQGYPAGEACKLGVFLHGYSADLVARQKGEIGITATDVMEMLPYAYKNIRDEERHRGEYNAYRQ
ncbi:MAG: NAD(P)H-hydrate dehydratase [Geobacteraceae bacterium]